MPVIQGKRISSAGLSDATTVYMGSGNITPTTNTARAYSGLVGTITEVLVQFHNTIAIASNEATTLYLNKNGATSETLISNSATLDAVNVDITLTGLSIPVDANDYFSIQIVGPTWATNPQGYISFIIKVEE